MQGFGRYSVLHQAHARANAEKAAQERKDASREVTDRRQERKDRDPPAERPVERSNSPETAGQRPSRPIATDSRSMLLPNGPAPGESEGHYEWRRRTVSRLRIEQAATAAKEADAIPRAQRTETDPVRRNKEIQDILSRRAAEAEARQARGSKDKESEKGVEINDD